MKGRRSFSSGAPALPVLPLMDLTLCRRIDSRMVARGHRLRWNADEVGIEREEKAKSLQI
jgi:hypothetical protein